MVNQTGRDGFSLIEVIMAVLVLSIGLLGLAGTTGFVVRQTALAEVTTERAVATQSVIERLRALELADVAAGSVTLGNFEIDWTLLDDQVRRKTVQIITTGPGLGRIATGFPTLRNAVEDTVTIQLVDLNGPAAGP